MVAIENIAIVGETSRSRCKHSRTPTIAGDRPPRYGEKTVRVTVGRGPSYATRACERVSLACVQLPDPPPLCRSGSPDPDLFVIRRSQTTEGETNIVTMRSRGTGPRATVKITLAFHRRAGACPSPLIALRKNVSCSRSYRRKSRPGGLSYPDITRKFPNNSFPATVRIDSGWNCTPQTGNVLCRRPMISP